MAGQFDLPDWLTTQNPWSGSDAFIKGSQAGAAVAANRLRAKQLYIDVQQHQQKMDLAERQFATENEATTLKNEVIRTKLANDAADFQTLREWWPQFQSSEGEIEMPVLRDENTMLKVSAAVAEKRSKIGQAAFAELMATPGFDLANPEHQKQYFELLSRYKNIPAKLGPDGVMGPIKVAEGLKRLRDEADSRIAARTDRSELNALIEERRALLADSTVELNDARILDLQNDIAFAERRAAIQEGNLELRREELSQKGKRLSIRSQRMYDNELKALNEEEKAKLSGMSATGDEANLLRKNYNLRRRALTDKFYSKTETSPPAPAPVQREGLKTEDRTNTPPAVAAPADTNIRRQGGNLFQQQPDGTWKFIGPAQ